MPSYNATRASAARTMKSPIARGDIKASFRSERPNPGESIAPKRVVSASRDQVGSWANTLSGHGLSNRASESPGSLSTKRMDTPSMIRKVGLPSISLRRWFCWRVVMTRSPQVRLGARLRQNDESESLGRWYRSRLLSREQLHPAPRDQAPPVRGAGESIVISPTVHGGVVARLRPCAACP